MRVAWGEAGGDAGRARDRSWWHARAPRRREVEGGVGVPRPGQVTSQAAVALIADAEMEAASPGILSRARSYARLGQVVSVRVEPGEFTAAVQGTGDQPYAVALRAVTISGSPRTDATCDCPYGCDFGWCKHAAALAYVAAHLLDTDPGCLAAWTGQAAQESGPALVLRVPEDLLARLRRPVAAPDVATVLAQAAAIVPLPLPLTRPEPPTDQAPNPTGTGAQRPGRVGREAPTGG